MTRPAALIASLAMFGTVVLAHGGNEHVRGVVTKISEQAITVQTVDKATKTLTLTDKTTFQLAGKMVHLADLKVGDRVAVEVPERTTQALSIQIGVAPKAAATKKVP